MSATIPIAIALPNRSFIIFLLTAPNAGLVQTILHALHADAGRCFGRARAAPVRLQADGVMVSIACQRLELPSPIDKTYIDRLPLERLLWIAFNAFYVLHVTVA